MNVLVNTINKLNSHISEVPGKIKFISEDDLSNKPSPDKWSRKEILGHLCDSAVNNISRFIKAQFEPEPFVITPYNQDEWVKLGNYQLRKTRDIIEYWTTLNEQIINIISSIPKDKLAIECEYNGASYRDPGREKNLLWLIEDYLAHMEYHLKQILPNR